MTKNHYYGVKNEEKEIPSQREKTDINANLVK